jgi:hypothetical protein
MSRLSINLGHSLLLPHLSQFFIHSHPINSLIKHPTIVQHITEMKVKATPSLFSCQPAYGPKTDLYYCQTVASLLTWGVDSDEKKDLAAGLRQGSHSLSLSLSLSLLYFPYSQNLATSSYSSLHVDSILPQFYLIFFLFYCYLPTGLFLQSSNRIFCRLPNVYMLHWFQLPLFDCPNTLEAEQAYKLWNTSIWKFLHFSLLRPHIPLTTLLSNTIS